MRLLQDRNRIPRTEPSHTGRFFVLALVWLGLLATAFAGLLKYESIPGHSSTAAPAQNSEFCDGASFSLVMGLHPHCPCSNASIGELTKIYSRVPDRIKITVLVFKPKDESDSWIESSTVRSLSKMNPRIVVDSDGALAKNFGLATSGQVLLYSPTGKLLFNGGITSARAHSGDNLGEDTILELVRNGSAAIHSTAVFGCPILKCESAP